jgi:histidyl-tRNA synthetase
MAEKLQPVRGTHDLLPELYAQHQQVITTAQEIAMRYGFARMDTPIFEFSDVFHRAVGETSDIVSKETYTFTDRGGESITLRPEFTAAIVRAFISNGLQQLAPFKCFYAGPAFRYERPQKGRQRQFHQIGCELLGAAAPEADVEMMALAQHILSALGLAGDVTLELNSLGDTESRMAYREALVQYLSKYKTDLSEDSQMRLEKNPLRILDSKSETDKKIIADAPSLAQHFTTEAQQFFASVQEGLMRLGIVFTVNARLVRGLDYYNHTVFEFTTEKLGAQGTVLAGGRYDALVATMGGPETAGIGFAAGVERLVALRENAADIAHVPAPEIAVIPMGEAEEAEAWRIAQQLRHGGYRTDIAYKGKSKKRFERADKLGAQVAVILGTEELNAGEVTLKLLQHGTQTRVKRDALLTQLQNLLSGLK